MLVIEVHHPVDVVLLNDVFAALVLLVLKSLLDSIGDGSPVRWAEDNKAHPSLEVWLVKAWEHLEAVEGLKLRVQVLALVLLIDEGVETNTVLIIWCKIFELDGVPSLDKLRWL